MKLFSDQIAFNTADKLNLPQKCCCCLVDITTENRFPYSVDDSKHGGTHIKNYSLSLPLCEACFEHGYSRNKSSMFRIILYVVLFLVVWGLSELVTLKPEIWVGIFFGVVILSEVYWKIKYIKHKKFLRNQGHADLRDFAEIRVKKPELAILTFKSERFAEMVRELNAENKAIVKNVTYRK